MSPRVLRVPRTLARVAPAAWLVAAWLLAGAVPALATEDTGLLDRLRAIEEGGHAQAEAARKKRTAFHFAIDLAARRNGLAPSLLWAVVRVESNFDPEAVSPVGAQGLGQLMPITAEELGVHDPFDPRQNLDAAAAYLASLIERFGDVRLALAGYNAGPSRARAMLDDPESQTYGYVERVLRFEREFRAREDL